MPDSLVHKDACDIHRLAPWATPDADNERPHRRHGVSPRLSPTIRNGRPFAFPAAGRGAVVMCLLPKVGSTTWKLVLLSGLWPRRHDELLERSPHQRSKRSHRVPEQPPWALRRAVRIIVVRNPYVSVPRRMADPHTSSLRLADTAQSVDSRRAHAPPRARPRPPPRPPAAAGPAALWLPRQDGAAAQGRPRAG